ncbi:sensor histidine kinase (plasmid) [Fulvitalea axinellae]|uniref:Sensor histidine kinase n=1 Tax=Fulvitalea axinellae TaxID=1182444 RepID=A0AAU9CJS1_9BACT|nr:sensor histidine kinase [Fulvitalea axinellae]
MSKYGHLAFWAALIGLRFTNLLGKTGVMESALVILCDFTVYIAVFYLSSFLHRKYFKASWVSAIIYTLSVVATAFLGAASLRAVNVALSIFAGIDLSVVVYGAGVFKIIFFMTFGLLFEYGAAKGKAERETREINRQKQEAELLFLKNQMNPHFFFNTLNNLYGLVYRKDDRAPDILLKLSETMRYIIYETKNDTVPLQKEIAFVRNYFELEKLRFRNKDRVNLKTKGEFASPIEKIAPLVLLPCIENCFKHSDVDNRTDTFIDITISVNGKSLSMQCQNSINLEKVHGEGGVGLDNIRKRMELLYPNNHTFETYTQNGIYIADINIPLSSCNSNSSL